MVTSKRTNKDMNETFKYIPVGRKDLVRGRGLCDRCLNVVSVFYYSFRHRNYEHNCVCVDCVLELDPPKWELIQATTNQLENNLLEPIGHYDLWDNTHMRQERAMTLKEAISCGWFIRRMEESKQTVPRRTVRKINLEYYGNSLCVRFTSHYEKLGLEEMNFCKAPFCEFMNTSIYNRMH